MAFGRKKKQKEEQVLEQEQAAQPQVNPFIGPDGRARIAVAGAGEVGLAAAVLLARHNDVMVCDVVPERVRLVNARLSPVADPELEAAFASSAAGEMPLALGATTDPAAAYQTAAIAIIAVPSSFDAEQGRYDSTAVEAAVQAVRAVNPLCWIVIESTVPVGYTAELRQRLGDARIVCSPSFARQGHGLHDALHPSRIVVGVDLADATSCEFGAFFARLLAEGADEPIIDVPQMVCGSADAEAIKLFSDTYLALRVSYFNEVDSYAATHGLNAAQVIEGMSLDPRIGNFHNNPSFGFGGCMPVGGGGQPGVAVRGFSSVVARTNHWRADFIADQVQGLLRERGGFGTGVHPVVGIYRLLRTPASQDMRDAAVYEVMEVLRERGIDMVVYEPLCETPQFAGVEVVPNLDELKRRSTLILANRYNAELDDMRDMVYTRDLFGRG